MLVVVIIGEDLRVSVASASRTALGVARRAHVSASRRQGVSLLGKSNGGAWLRRVEPH